MDQRWNHNIHYHRVIVDAVPSSARTALDIGCGDGLLVRDLAAKVPRVVGIDVDAPSIERARGEVAGLPGDPVELVVGDALTYPFARGSFDVVASVATLHHVDARVGLLRMRELVGPGGLIGVVGLAAVGSPADAVRSLAGAAANTASERTNRRTSWEHQAPTVWPPPETYGSMRKLVAELLPGARFRTHLYWRYSILWTRPLDG